MKKKAVKKRAARKSVRSPTGKPSRKRAEIEEFDTGSPARATRGGKRPPPKKKAARKNGKPPLVGGAYAGRKRKQEYDEQI